MSQFIQRDYLTPMVMTHTNKVALKNLYRKMQPTYMIGDTEVFCRGIYFRGNQGTGFGQYPTSGDNAIRNDPIFKRFLRKLGVNYKDLVNSNYDGTKKVYFVLDQKKLNFSAQTPEYVVTKYNNDYLKKMYPLGATLHPNYYFNFNAKVNTTVAILPFSKDLARYKFLVSGSESSLSEDGYFSITDQGIVSITQLGIDNEVQYFSFDSSNSHTYTVKKVLNDLTYTTEPINITCQREYIDIRITVGGQYQNRINYEMLNSTNWITEDIPGTFDPTIQDLALIRAAIDADPRAYLGNMIETNEDRWVAKGISPINRLEYANIRTTSATLLSAVGGIAIDDFNGHKFDTLCVLDNGEIFDVEPNVFNEVVNIQAVGGTRIGDQLYGESYNLSYSYTKRYRIKALATETSQVIVQSVEAAQWVENSLNYYGTNLAKLRQKSMAATAAKDTLMKQAIYELNDDGFEPSMFINGRLKVSAFDAMTPNEFAELLGRTIDIGYSTPKASFFDKVLAVVIVVIAISIFVFTLGSGAPISAALIATAAAFSTTFLVVAGMLYAKHIDGAAWGMKIIGSAIQVNAVILAIAATMSGYADIQAALANIDTLGVAAAAPGMDAVAIAAIETASTDMMIGIGTSALGMAGSSLSLAGQLGIDIGISDDATAIIGLMSAGLSLTSNVRGLMNNGLQLGSKAGESISQTAFRNVSGFVDNIGAAGRGYLAIQQLMQGSAPSQTSQDQGEIESDGVERVYLLQEVALKNDVLSKVDEYVQGQYGINNTRMVLAKQYPSYTLAF